MNNRLLKLAISALLASPVTLASIPAAMAANPTSAAAIEVNMRHAQPITLRNTVIGQGAPKTIVPTTGATAEQVLAQARAIGANPDVDLIEFRIDYLDFATDPGKIAALGKQVVEAVHGKPLILTFRTQAEGGVKAIADDDYGTLYKALIKEKFIDLLDVEMFRDPRMVQEVVTEAHQAGVKVVMSSHDFKGTPSTEEIVARLRKQDAMGADVLKIAVMPKSPADVIRLLDASAQVRADYSQKPQLNMSMGGLGAISRLSGEVFGSDLTFGMIGEPSAPGQVEVGQLRQVLGVIHASVNGGK
ncbi:type I 3-dehydroquinate dehydratase [Pseudomonas capeferrum]|uniref:type I 3-dehydroquinate dehydratase n=1 Tax=Pseudomonas capeferrum TaxID=1495066 RepID=UPI0015E43839|nr:type I 3-dehydroquinate dehydratase [Pseudomonas capeferrum]MBA1200354.1 type I 3-dehydroquinate dehydratase [Pseudomonas capeferrum]